MTRRDRFVAIGIVVTSALLLVVVAGIIVSLGVRRGEEARFRREQTTASAQPLVPADRIPVLCYHYVRAPG